MNRGLRGLGFLGYAGQRVEFTHDADDRLAAAPLRDEGGRHPRKVGLDRESVAFQFLLQDAGALVLLEAEFRSLPDLPRDSDEAVGMCRHTSQHVVGRAESRGAQE